MVLELVDYESCVKDCRLWKQTTEIWKGMQTISDDLYACWDQNGYTRGDPLHVPIVAADPHIPFVSEIIRGRAENRCILLRRVVQAWICHGALPSWGNGRFYGL